MKVIGVARLGKDAELRRMTNGEPVVNFTVAWNWGKKDDKGMRASQWLDCAVFGPLGERLIDYLKKSTQVFISGRDLHVETFQKRDGSTGNRLCATIDSIEILSKKEVPF